MERRRLRRCRGIAPGDADADGLLTLDELLYRAPLLSHAVPPQAGSAATADRHGSWRRGRSTGLPRPLATTPHCAPHGGLPSGRWPCGSGGTGSPRRSRAMTGGCAPLTPPSGVTHVPGQKCYPCASLHTICSWCDRGRIYTRFPDSPFLEAS